MFFFFNDTATTEIYTLSLHDALPILHVAVCPHGARGRELGGEQHRGPDDAMKPRDPLAHHVEIGRPQAVVAGRREAGGREVVDERVEPDVYGLLRVAGERDAPRLALPRDRNVLQAGLEQAQ